jgi:hypothetical protein
VDALSYGCLHAAKLVSRSMSGSSTWLRAEKAPTLSRIRTHQGSAPGLGGSVGLGEGEGEGLGDGDGLGEGDGDGERDGLGEGLGVGFGLDALALGDEPEGGRGGAGDSKAISRPNVTGRITLDAWDELGLASEGESAGISETGDGEAT